MMSAPIRLPLRLPSPPSTTMASMVTSGASHMNGSTTNTGDTTTPAIAASATEDAYPALERRRNSEVVPAEGEQHQLLEYQRERDGRDQHRRLVLAHRLDHQPVAQHREQRHPGDRDRPREDQPQPDFHQQRVETVRREHVEGGVRDVDDARHAEDQRKADREQRVHTAVDEPR